MSRVKKPRKPIPWFTVWFKDEKPDARTPGTYSSPDARMAAQVHAAYSYRAECKSPTGELSDWPQTLVVRDETTLDTYEVDVVLELRPEFTSGKARKIG